MLEEADSYPKHARDSIWSVYFSLSLSSGDSFDRGYSECYLKCQLVLAAQLESLTNACETIQSCQMSREVTLIEYRYVRALSVGWEKNETQIMSKFNTEVSQSRKYDWASHIPLCSQNPQVLLKLCCSEQGIGVLRSVVYLLSPMDGFRGLFTWLWVNLRER